MYYQNTFMHFLFGWIISLVFSLVRFFRPSPARISVQAWSFQQAGFLIQDMILLAQSKGIGMFFLYENHIYNIFLKYYSALCFSRFTL